MNWLLSILVVFSGVASAKQIVRGEPAQAMYEELVKAQQDAPEAFTMYTNMFFGDDLHPERGRLWLTTIFLTQDSSRICYQYDYREAGVIDYMCEHP